MREKIRRFSARSYADRELVEKWLKSPGGRDQLNDTVVANANSWLGSRADKKTVTLRQIFWDADGLIEILIMYQMDDQESWQEDQLELSMELARNRVRYGHPDHQE